IRLDGGGSAHAAGVAAATLRGDGVVMSDALSRLVQRVLAPETVLQPRVPALFSESGGGEAAALESGGRAAAAVHTERIESIREIRDRHSTTATHETTMQEIVARETIRERELARETTHHHHATHETTHESALVRETITEPRFVHLAVATAPPPLPR